MDELFKIIDRMVNQYKTTKPINFDSLALKECLLLLENGFKIIEYKSVPKSLKISVIFKSDDQEKSVDLSLSEQKMWMAILEKREELRKNVKSI